MLLSKWYFGALYSLSITSAAEVKKPLFAAVAAIERASISATEEICPLCNLEPSRFGKFLVEWRILNALLAGVSPAPKQGPQNAVFTIVPAAIRSATAPFLTSSIYTGVLAGYTLNVNASEPIFFPLMISAAAQIFSNPPPAHPAIIPCST